ncbi:hypothetical protein AGOR_G00242660 [Albula goreensis]|uniref:Uncharacterized protein n=1 Tax=Albula goreensis TaxID=1534307 RepID=A0A8T3CH57_9TELE|nr:hypothetical protein AGOR_G00242660 [Albula goreensis]
MMDKQNANGFHPKASVNGEQRRPVPYSVETPYGFRLDLDFLKYVDDIEKGNTIKRVFIQRRNRGPKFSTLPRNFSLPGYGYGCGYRPTQRDTWASSPALGPVAKTHLSEELEFGACDGVPLGVPGSPGVSYATLRALEEASIKAFDEQPLGVHVRPYLLRASSMPVTTLQRASSEASDERAAPAPGGPRWENGSAEDVFGGGPPPGGPGLQLQLAAALQRITELEEQARVVGELRAQIFALREDKQRLLLRLHPKGQPQDRSTESGMDPPGSPSAVNKSSPEQKEGEIVTDGGAQGPESPLTGSDTDPTSITILQDRITDLQEKLCQSCQDLEESSTRLRDLTQDNRLKEDRIKQLSERVHAEPGANQKAENRDVCDTPANTSAEHEHSEGASTHHSDVGTEQKDLTSSGTQTDVRLPASKGTACSGDPPQHPDTMETDRPSTRASIELYVARIRALLQEQWECMSRGDPDKTLQQPGSKMSSLQTELLSYIQTLSSLCASPAQTGGATNQAALKSIMKKSDSAEKLGVGGAKKNLKFVGVNGGYETTSSEESSSEESVEGGQEHGDDSVAPGDPAGDSEGGVMGVEPGSRAREPREGPPAEQPGRNLVDEDFKAVCLFLKDRLEEVASPNNEMRQALTVLYQVWFHASSQKDSEAETVALYLAQAQDAAPAILHFLVNLADANDNTALHYSVSHSNFAIVKLLLDTGLCDVDHRNKAGYTAIMLASLTLADSPEDMEVVQKLMELGDINARASQAGRTALMLAVSHGRVAMVGLLLAGGADVNMQDQDGSTPLMWACEHGHAHITSLLLQHGGCDTSLTDKVGRTALSLALDSSHSEIADLLRAHGDAGPR